MTRADHRTTTPRATPHSTPQFRSTGGGRAVPGLAPAERDRTRAITPRRPRSLANAAWLIGPVDLLRVALATPARVLDAGQGALRTAEQLPALVDRMRAVLQAAELAIGRIGAADVDAELVHAPREMAERLQPPLLVALSGHDPAVQLSRPEVTSG